MLSALPDFLASLFFPPDCETCGTPLSVPGVCGRCQASIAWLSPPFCAGCGRTHAGPGRCGLCGGGAHFDRAFACAVYDGPMREALQRFKFQGRKALNGFLSGALTRFAETHLDARENFDCVAAVPLEPGRRRERGFNQSELLARGVARRFGVPDVSARLARRGGAAAQSTLGKALRRENVSGRFRALDPAAFAGRRVLLVDDILTTGETASECARVLKESGAASVTVLACARGA